jgi:hypothetical protein
VDAIERIYHEWDERLAQNDAEGLVALYAADATFESPLVPHLMNIERGILRGHGELRAFFEKLAQRKPEVRRHYRAGYLTDGRMLMWEYPREAPAGEQMDFVEVMECLLGLVRRQDSPTDAYRR